jgi:glycosyltransferase involved in cell wall biosynthesis
MKIGMAGDSVLLPTSYGKTSQKLLRILSERGHEVYNYALQHAGAPVQWEHVTVYQAQDVPTFSRALSLTRPDVVIHLRDNWVMTRYYRQPYHLWDTCREYSAKLFNYSPVQSWPLPKDYINTVWYEADYTITMTRIGMQKLIEQGAPASRLFYLYHGADQKQFHFMNERPPRSMLGLPDYDRHMITFVGLNQDHRKMIPLSILAFKTYMEKYDPDAFLYLHTDAMGFFDVQQHVIALGLGGQGKVFMRPSAGMGSSLWGFSDEQMGQLYNMSDCLITMTTAEGFNMPVLESIACGTPVVMTDTPVHRELFSQFGMAHFVPSRKIFPNAYTLEWLADPDAAADLIHEAVQQGRGKVELPDCFRWENIVLNLEGIFEATA